MDGKKTPLYDEHRKLGGKMIDFAGWILPEQYEGLVSEHNAVRKSAGIFDVSHMGTFNITGKEAEKFLDYLVTNDISKANDKQVTYTFMVYTDGGVLDDLLVYKYDSENFLLVVNAANAEKDLEWIKAREKKFEIEIDATENIAILALQGPKSQEILQKLTDTDLSSIKFFYLENEVKINGVNSMISRTGYTGEDGFEVYIPNESAPKVWNDILEAGKEEGLKPAGLGARDTLRFEAGLALYGQEISPDITPFEAGYRSFVKLNKESGFIGKGTLARHLERGLERTQVGFKMIERGIPRKDYEVYKNGENIGHVTTGYMSPTLNEGIGNALIAIDEKEIGNEIDIMIRGKAKKAEIINKNFLK